MVMSEPEGKRITVPVDEETHEEYRIEAARAKQRSIGRFVGICARRGLAAIVAEREARARGTGAGAEKKERGRG